MTWYEYGVIVVVGGYAVRAVSAHFLAKMLSPRKQPFVISPFGGYRVGEEAVKQEGLLARWWSGTNREQGSTPDPPADSPPPAPGA